MKTRIVYSKMWNDDKFPGTDLVTKVLFLYLLSCDSIGLSPYHHITDRQIMFDTGLDFKGLETAKKQLTELKWCFFMDNWIYHNHDCAYLDYSGRDRVTDSKAKEMAAVPQKVHDYFNPLKTRYKGCLNHKSEIINHKPETSNPLNGKGYQSAKKLANSLGMDRKK